MTDAFQPRPLRVLGVESSCDETAAAVVDGLHVLSSVVASQVEVHASFGGVVPELASRHHLGAVSQVMEAALRDAGVHDPRELDAIAVTDRPGLVGALLVGVQAGRGLGLATGLPVIGVHHLEGHLLSAFLGDELREARSFAPHLALVVSGGHTELVHVRALGEYEILGATRDDAAGEAYDKVAKLLGLGYPGGPVIDRLAAEGRSDAVVFPRAMMGRDSLDFSFSGLKTAVMTHLDRDGEPTSREALADLCASFQAAVVDVLVRKTAAARARCGVSRVHVVGGVAANRGLRAGMVEAGERDGFDVEVAPLRYCGDNAAMIAAAGALRLAAGDRPRVDVRSGMPLDDPALRLRS